MTERTIPILPCRSIDDTLAFYEAIGFTTTYRQERPNTYAVVVRGGIELQFFTLKGLDPPESYSTCYVLVDDVDALYAAFTVGLRASLGRVPVRGIPRIGALRDMSYGVRQFIVVDPGGNHVRIGQPIESRRALRVPDAGRLARALEAAVTLADSKGDDVAAARALDAALTADPTTPAVIRLRALIVRADLDVRLGRPDAARAWLAEAAGIVLDDADARAAADEIRRGRELAEALGPPDPWTG